MDKISDLKKNIISKEKKEHIDPKEYAEQFHLAYDKVFYYGDEMIMRTVILDMGKKFESLKASGRAPQKSVDYKRLEYIYNQCEELVVSGHKSIEDLVIFYNDYKIFNEIYDAKMSEVLT